MGYVGNIYRPPSEAYSFILQVTVGCSHNSCTFCSSFKSKKYHEKDLEEIRSDIAWAKQTYGQLTRVFLADGDALSADTEFLLKILTMLREAFPNLERVGAYAGPWSLLDKTPAELEALHKAGLSILYLGLESGNAEVLGDIVKKTATPADMIAAANKAHATGFTLSVTIILGLGGEKLTLEHAQDTAKVLNAMQPHYVGALTLLLDEGAPLLRKVQSGEFRLLNPVQILEELKVLVGNFQLNNCVFRTNHASNYLVLGGTLPQDKQRMLVEIEQALQHLRKGNDGMLRPESYRRL
ncbi:MAG TPA: radical SAM protein [Bacillota bacterium]|nr:radical SAM protein [Bacillota bacterium]